MWCGMISERAGSIDGTVARGGGWGTYLDSVSESTLASASPPAGVALSTASSFDPLTLLVTNKRIGGAGNVDGSIAVDTAKGAAQGGGVQCRPQWVVRLAVGNQGNGNTRDVNNMHSA